MTNKPPGWIRCPHCEGTTYLFERISNADPNGPKMRMTQKRCDKCIEGFMELK